MRPFFSFQNCTLFETRGCFDTTKSKNMSDLFRLAPIDTPDSLPHFRHLVNLFEIPSAFVAERFQSITHSFGTRKLEDGSQSTSSKVIP